MSGVPSPEQGASWSAASARLLALLGALLALPTIGGCCVFSASRYRGPVSDHFDGQRFHNQQPVTHGSIGDLVRWQLDRDQGPWRDWTDAEPGPKPAAQVERGRLRVTFVNHATLLIQLDGLNVLTDPIWSERASPVGFAGPSRVRPPGIPFADLPPIHAVLVSHNHYDHLDLPTLRQLHQAHHPRFFVGLGNGQLLQQAGIDQVTEIDWWERVSLGQGVVLHGVPAAHFSARGGCDQNATLWMGFAIQGEAGLVYFAGDTGFGPHFTQIRERLGAPRLALLPIGAFRPRWFMSPIHLSPAEAVRAHRHLGARHSVAMHFGTFKLADDGQHEPVVELWRAMADAGVSRGDFWVLRFGEGRDVPPRAMPPPAIAGAARLAR